MNTQSSILRVFLAASCALLAALFFTGCANTGADQNYQNNRMSYERVTPFFGEDGSWQDEKLIVITDFDQEVQASGFELSIDSQYERGLYDGDSLSLTQPDSWRGGSLYMRAGDYTATISVEAVKAQTDGDTAQLESNNDAIAEIGSAAIEGTVDLAKTALTAGGSAILPDEVTVDNSSDVIEALPELPLGE
ncbi:MAG: hypothetical protein AAF065_11980 [Verrucomicrobiota bacterium]